MLQLAIVNGPNLNLVGIREPHIYGNIKLEDYFITLQKKYANISLEFYQTNGEGELIDILHSCRGRVQGIVLNGGAYTHTSIALADAVAAVEMPVVEVHISNIYAREDFRKTSYTAAKAVGCITGLGLLSYDLAITYLVDKLAPESA